MFPPPLGRITLRTHPSSIQEIGKTTAIVCGGVMCRVYQGSLSVLLQKLWNFNFAGLSGVFGLGDEGIVSIQTRGFLLLNYNSPLGNRILKRKTPTQNNRRVFRLSLPYIFGISSRVKLCVSSVLLDSPDRYRHEDHSNIVCPAECK